PAPAVFASAPIGRDPGASADATPSADDAPLPAPPQTPPPDATTPALVLARQQEPVEAEDFEETDRHLPAYEPGKGFLFVDEKEGELGMGMFSYARYINQNGLNPTYVDAFGRTKSVERNQSLQFQKISMNLKGWLFDPKFRYYYFFWTANPNMGEGAQVVLGGYFQYRFDPAFIVTAGVMPVPTTRSTNYTFPNWLRNDNRVMADEFFRGSYSTGIDAQGEILPRLHYRVALTNNLAQLGISAAQLNNGLDTVSGAVWWMPTTGEFGPSNGFGDYEEHEKLATLFGAHFTSSTETAQEQPGVNTIENSQIRLSDGTLLFSPNAFNTSGSITQADYRMAAVNAGMKYRGLYLEGEYYWRWVDDFVVTGGTVPVDSLYDHGYTLRGSVMFVPKRLQGYVTGSHIFGEYGDPSEIALGVNWYPFQRKEVRLNAQALRLDHSPIGSNVLVAQVGGDGWVFNTDLIVQF
ncbi:OprO/OprP family phosphate-selective porin, partial [Caulobacter sp. 17J80-11]|uniref:OprO/OprP family phosphate-selective porin n=1 Tax=Caulobacter sp. 17J80-11 TaxID=2763502 RepID=UPI001CA3AA63